MKKHLLVAFFSLCVLASHSQPEKKRMRQATKKEYTSFVLTGFDVKIVEANEFSYKYPTGNSVEVRQIGQSLSLRVTGAKADRNKSHPRTPLTIYIRKEKIKQMKLVDCTLVYPTLWKSPQLRIVATSSSQVSFKKIDIDQLSVTASAGVNLDFSGKSAISARFTVTSNSTMSTSNMLTPKLSCTASASSVIDIVTRADDVRLVASASSRIIADVKADRLSMNITTTSRIEADLDTNYATLEVASAAMAELTGRTRELKIAENDGAYINRKKLTVDR